jgi:hypothetical protein
MEPSPYHKYPIGDIMIVKLANNIGKWHGQFFGWLSRKATTSKWFALGLTLWALYEIFEHIALPTIMILWGTGHITSK